jgi:hypothetical protein
MKVQDIIKGLREEHELISIAIARLEAILARSSPKGQQRRGRGRPPGSKNKPRPESGQKPPSRKSGERQPKS